MATSRMDKIDELIKNELSGIISALFPDQIISITQVHVSKDLSYAKIWISSLSDVDSLVKECQKEKAIIRKSLSSKLELRKTPNLHFVSDKTSIEAIKIETLIKKTKE